MCILYISYIREHVIKSLLELCLSLFSFCKMFHKRIVQTNDNMQPHTESSDFLTAPPSFNPKPSLRETSPTSCNTASD